MCVTLVGGMDRLRPQYEEAAREEGHRLKFIPANEPNFLKKLGEPDLFIVFTNKISHEAKRKTAQFARKRNIRVEFAHSCGVSTLKTMLNK